MEYKLIERCRDSSRCNLKRIAVIEYCGEVFEGIWNDGDNARGYEGYFECNFLTKQVEFYDGARHDIYYRHPVEIPENSPLYKALMREIL
jgi:hypothetical protein